MGLTEEREREREREKRERETMFLNDKSISLILQYILLEKLVTYTFVTHFSLTEGEGGIFGSKLRDVIYECP